MNKLYFLSKIKPRKNKATRECRITHRKFKRKIFEAKNHSSYVISRIVCKGEGVFSLDILQDIQPIVRIVCKICSSEIQLVNWVYEFLLLKMELVLFPTEGIWYHFSFTLDSITLQSTFGVQLPDHDSICSSQASGIFKKEGPLTSWS